MAQQRLLRCKIWSWRILGTLLLPGLFTYWQNDFDAEKFDETDKIIVIPGVHEDDYFEFSITSRKSILF